MNDSPVPMAGPDRDRDRAAARTGSVAGLALLAGLVAGCGDDAPARAAAVIDTIAGVERLTYA
ncbi:MAG: hypothetical protein ACOCUW_03970, partial [Gemmatimonadota bacterium]